MPKLPPTFINQIICGDAQKVLRCFSNASVDCVVTSPPYWAMRDYGVREQIGLETSVEAYLEKLCGVFDEVRRVLKDSGTCVEILWRKLKYEWLRPADGETTEGLFYTIR